MATRYISRSGHEALMVCPRRYYWGYEYAGTGLESPTPDLTLVIGLGVHKGMEVLMRALMDGATLDDRATWEHAADEAYDEVITLTYAHREKWAEDPRWLGALEEAALLAWAEVYGWCRSRLAEFKARYRVLQVEKELETPLGSDVVLRSRLDVLVVEIETDLIWVINWKTSAKNDPDKLYEDYSNDPQMWTEAVAAEWDQGEPVKGTLVEVLFKGVLRSWRHCTSLLYAYEKSNEPRRPSYSAGWKPVRADGLSGLALHGKTGTLRNWIESLPEDILNAHFFQLKPILKNKEVVEDRLAGWVYREGTTRHVLAKGTEADKLMHFGARDGYWCKWCTFRGPCKEGGSIEGMIATGQLVPRVDHHAKREQK